MEIEKKLKKSYLFAWKLMIRVTFIPMPDFSFFGHPHNLKIGTKLPVVATLALFIFT